MNRLKITLTTTLQRIKEAHSCTDGYRKLAKHLGGCESYGMDTEINLLTILESNGVQDMLWCLRCTVQDSRRTSSQLAIEFAAECLPIFEKHCQNDCRPRHAIDASRGYLAGAVTLDELKKAHASADAAADAAAYAAYAAYAAHAAAAAYAAHAAAAAAAIYAYAAYAADAAAYAADAAAYASYAAARSNAKLRQADIIRMVLS